MRVILVLLPGVVMGVLASVSMSLAADAARPLPAVVVDVATVVDDPVIVDLPAFPGVVRRERGRLSAGSFVAPEAGFGDNEISLVRPEVRAQANLPISPSTNLQVTADLNASLYDVDGRDALFADCAQCREPDHFYSAALGTQGGYRLNDEGHLLLRDEQWALLGAVFVRARWESGAFSDSVTPGFSLGVGYQLPDRLRLALGARIERALDGDGVAVGPSVYVRWDPLPNVRLKSRGLGGQLEFQPNKRFDLFVTGFRASDSFRLDDRPGLASGATFQDGQALVGGGVMLRVMRELRFVAEIGAIVDRRVSIKTRPDGRLDARNGDPSPYFGLRAEARI